MNSYSFVTFVPTHGNFGFQFSLRAQPCATARKVTAPKILEPDAGRRETKISTFGLPKLATEDVSLSSPDREACCSKQMRRPAAAGRRVDRELA